MPPRAATVLATCQAWADACHHALLLWAPKRRRAPRHDRRVLILTRMLPPHFHGGSLRQLALIRALVKDGWEVDAVTDPPPAEPPAAGLDLVSRIPETVRMHRWRASVRQGSYRWSPELSGGFTSISSIIDTAMAAGSAPSVVLASGPPFAEFVAAAVVARRYQACLVLDYRDEWTTSPFTFVQRGRGDRAFERGVLARTDALVFTTDSSRDHYQAAFPGLRNRKTLTIRNGWDSMETEVGLPGARGAPGDLITIGFFGWLAEHWDFEEFTQTLTRTLSARPELQGHVHLRVYGRIMGPNLRAMEAMGSSVPFTLHGLIPHAVARQAMAKADALLLFTSSRLARSLSGKLFHYIASKRPILLYGTGGEMADIVGRLPGATIVPRGQPSALGEGLARLISRIPEAEIAAAPPDYPDEFHRRHRDREWQALFESLVQAGP